MKNLLWIGLFTLLQSCNNTGTTAQPNDLDHTDVNDSTSANANRHNSLKTKDTMALDSPKSHKK